jgi:hypothetical protein
MDAKKLPFGNLTEREKSRFWGKVIPSDECWEWTGYTVRSGYGMLNLRGDNFLAHRISWLITNGTDPFPLFVLHKCDNRKCCRPSHLFLGTNRENSLDSCKKGRRPHKLNGESVKAIRGLLKDGVPQRTIASKFGVAQSSIYDINIGKTWTFV